MNNSTEAFPHKEDIENVWVILVGYVGSGVSLVGLCVNLLSLVVLFRPDMRNTSGYYLIALAIYDLAYLVMNIAAVSLEYLYYGVTDDSSWAKKFTYPAYPVIQPLMYIMLTAGVWTTIFLSIDRAIGVTRPFEWPTICTKFRVKVVLFLTLVISVGSNVPMLMESYIGYDPDPEASGLTVLMRAYGSSHFHVEVYLKYCKPIFDSGIPVLVLVIVNLIILNTLRIQQRQRQALGAPQGAQGGQNNSTAPNRRSDATTRITAQVLFICFFTLVTCTMRTTTFIMMIQSDTLLVNFCSLECGIIAGVAHFCNILNATVNFFCYCYFGQRFRKSLKNLIANMPLGQMVLRSNQQLTSTNIQMTTTRMTTTRMTTGQSEVGFQPPDHSNHQPETSTSQIDVVVHQAPSHPRCAAVSQPQGAPACPEEASSASSTDNLLNRASHKDSTTEGSLHNTSAFLVQNTSVDSLVSPGQGNQGFGFNPAFQTSPPTSSSDIYSIPVSPGTPSRQ